ncbi:MAG: hypothetical protein ACKVTZ_03665 [Bacteroidia bacterium]
MKKNILLLSFLSFHFLFAQHGLQSAFQSDWVAGYSYQPTNIVNDSTLKTAKIGIDGLYFFNNNSISPNIILKQGNTLDSATKSKLIGQLKDPILAQQGTNYKFQAAFQTPKFPVLVSFAYRNNAFGRINNPQTIDLALNGNLKFQGVKVSDKEIMGGTQTYLEAAIGTGYKWKKFSVAGNVKYLNGRNALQLENLSYDFYTAKEGDTLDVSTNYDLHMAKGKSNTLGNGFAFDLGMAYEVGKGSVGLSLLNLGSIGWSGLRYANEVKVNYVGFEIKDFKNLMENGLSDFSNIGKDTVYNTIIPDSTTGKFTTQTPATANLFFSYPIKNQHTIYASVHTGLSKQAANYQKPLVNVGYQHRFCKFGWVGINAYAGGFDNFGLGCLLRGDIQIKESTLAFIATADNLLGFVGGKGMSMQGGIQVGF